MQVLVIHHSGDIGGGTLSCFDIIEALTENEYKVSLLLPPGHSDARVQAEKLGIRVIPNNFNAITFDYYNGGSTFPRILLKFLFASRNRKQWEKLFNTEKPDLVLLNSSVQWPMIKILNKSKIKVICFNRETLRGKRKSVINKIIAFNMQKASGVAFISCFDKKQWGLTSVLNQTVIPDMVDKKLFIEVFEQKECRKKQNLKEDKFYVLYVGGMSEFKGAKVIIEAINKIEDKRIELLFLGDLGSDLKNLNWIGKIRNRDRISFINSMNEYIQNNDLMGRIHFAGKQTNMKDWYGASDVVVFPAIKAHQARPIYEAGAFRKPIVVSDFPNYKEHLVHGVNGFVFEPGNANELAKTIERLSNDIDLYGKIKDCNYKFIRNKHSSDIVNEKIINFINKVSEQEEK